MTTRRQWRRAAGLGLAATVLAGTALLPTVPASAQPAVAQAHASGTTSYLDCSAGTDGDGTLRHPWNSLDTVDAHTFGPGDTLLLRRGATCDGVLSPQGSGADGRPIVVDAYGPASAGLPKIAGGGVDATVSLHDQSYWELRHLEITNADADPATRYTERRRGVVVSAEDVGEVRHIRLEGLDIHDVYGEGVKDLGGSGGIQLEVSANTDPANRVKTWFDDVVIADNTVEHVNRSGINMSTAWKCRREVGWDGCSTADQTGLPWVPWTGLVIRDNRVDDVGGDGIVVQMNKGALVEGNVVSDVANRPNKSNAGVWAWNADDTVFQGNEVYDVKKLSDNNDGTAFDADYGTRGTVFQNNYSHDNAGGMMLFCGCASWLPVGSAWASDVTFRYNVSENDAMRVGSLAGATDSAFYNNTIVVPDADGQQLFTDSTLGTNMLVANNLVISDRPVTDASTNSKNVVVWRNNVFAGPGSTWPPGDNTTLGSPLPLADGSGLDRFKIRDAALTKAGVPIETTTPGTDLFGDATPTTCAPDVGAYQYSSFDDADCTGLATRLAAGTDDTLTVPANATLQLGGTVSDDATLTVRNRTGAVQTATATSDATSGKTPVALVLRTASDATPVTVECTGTKGACARLTVQRLDDALVDGSFESRSNTPWSSWNTSRTTSDATSGQLRLSITGRGSAEQNVAVQPRTTYTLAGWVVTHATSADDDVRLGVKNTGANPYEHYASPTASGELQHVATTFTTGDETSVTVYCYQPGGSAEAGCDDLTLTTAASAPAVTVQPAATRVRTGDDVDLRAEFSGNGAPTVPWQVQRAGRWRDVPGATSTWLTLRDVNARSAARYRAVGTNAGGTVRTHAARVTVLPARTVRLPQTITVDPIADAVHSDRTVPVTAAASSGLRVTLEAHGACVAQGRSAVRLLRSGTCTVVARQAGDRTWLPARPHGCPSRSPGADTVLSRRGGRAAPGHPDARRPPVRPRLGNNSSKEPAPHAHRARRHLHR
ncbi:ricin-type beta-trefoil lectin domain protein [Luteimicrobium xylanilyticum]|uniref:Cellulase n=1 Tax=Luteimicrobium xylanilyticum TaxID=1133546 RepID=A0A5P9QDU0_9MICO|nr:carbohydrate binding domain-containing protein [Luteimicrobium xylanilyticum]QFU99648.1 Cellulase [Luteimicrobium xylanilyticum]